MCSRDRSQRWGWGIRWREWRLFWRIRRVWWGRWWRGLPTRHRDRVRGWGFNLMRLSVWLNPRRMIWCVRTKSLISFHHWRVCDSRNLGLFIALRSLLPRLLAYYLSVWFSSSSHSLYHSDHHNMKPLTSSSGKCSSIVIISLLNLSSKASLSPLFLSSTSVSLILAQMFSAYLTPQNEPQGN